MRREQEVALLFELTHDTTFLVKEIKNTLSVTFLYSALIPRTLLSKCCIYP